MWVIWVCMHAGVGVRVWVSGSGFQCTGVHVWAFRIHSAQDGGGRGGRGVTCITVWEVPAVPAFCTCQHVWIRYFNIGVIG